MAPVPPPGRDIVESSDLTGMVLLRVAVLYTLLGNFYIEAASVFPTPLLLLSPSAPVASFDFNGVLIFDEAFVAWPADLDGGGVMGVCNGGGVAEWD